MSYTVNNVGAIITPGRLHEHSENDLWNVIDLNVAATTFMTHLVIEDMKTRKKGAIINVSSASDIFPVPLLSVYAASKAFVRFFTDAIREEYSSSGITIQRLSPCFINTKLVSFSYTSQVNKQNFFPQHSDRAYNN